MERLDWKSYSSIAKSLGTVVSIAGAFVATLYKGPTLLTTELSPANSSKLFSQESNFMLGGLFLAADCVMASAYIIVQVKIIVDSLKRCHDQLFLKALTTIFNFAGQNCKEISGRVDYSILLLFLCGHSIRCDLLVSGKRCKCMELTAQIEIARSSILGN